jgi:hypothetical protein
MAFCFGPSGDRTPYILIHRQKCYQLYYRLAHNLTNNIARTTWSSHYRTWFLGPDKQVIIILNLKKQRFFIIKIRLVCYKSNYPQDRGPSRGQKDVGATGGAGGRRGTNPLQPVHTSGRTCGSRATAWDGGISPGTRRMSVCWGNPFLGYLSQSC